jgi:DNA-binding beta-propeller fold protein YncE
VANEGVVAGTSTISVISDSNNTVATIPLGEETLSRAGAIAYDSGKSEIFVTNTLFEPSLLNPTTNFISNTVSVISDSSNTSASPAPATSVSPTTVPEFSTEALILAMVLSGVIVVTFVRIKSKRKAFS